MDSSNFFNNTARIAGAYRFIGNIDFKVNSNSIKFENNFAYFKGNDIISGCTLGE